MLAVKKLSTNVTFLNCLKMGLHFSWNLDGSQQSGGAKDLVPRICVVQNSVSPQHPVELLWLAPSRSMTLGYYFVSVQSRKATLLELGSSKGRIREVHGLAWLSLVSISTDPISGVMVNSL